MKKILFLSFFIVLLVSCNQKPMPVPKYKMGEYVWFTKPGNSKIDTVLGQIVPTLGIFDEFLVKDDSTILYYIQYQVPSCGPNHPGYNKEWFKEKSIIGRN